MRVAITLAACLCISQSALAGGVALPEMVRIGAGELSWRPPGEFLLDGASVSGPATAVRFANSVSIMKHQVSSADYALCVADNACQTPGRAGAHGAMPVTGVNFSDATDYAAWLSQKSGMTFRLPTDHEWAFAAREKFYGDPSGNGATKANPAANQVERYAANALLPAPDPIVHLPGYFGTNSNGLADLSGNVWEWTSTCYQRATLVTDGSAIAHSTQNCGVRVLEGRHRAYLTFFIRDAKGGGCSIGSAPDHLGFRLVRETGRLEQVQGWLAGIWSAVAH